MKTGLVDTIDLPCQGFRAETGLVGTLDLPCQGRFLCYNRSCGYSLDLL